MHVFSCYFFPEFDLLFVVMTSLGSPRIWGCCRCLRSVGFTPGASNVLHLGRTGGYQDGFAVRLHTLIDSIVDVEFVGSIDCEATDSYMQFRRLLEDISIVDWPFFFWDNANHCTINLELERVNKVRIDVFVIANEESGGFGCKRRRHDNGGFSSELHEEIFPPLSM
jgi:hypothetical protein